MSEIHAVEILAAMNLVQLMFWGYQVHTLVNKLMCKDLAEYSLIKNGPTKSEKAPEVSLDDLEEERAILAEVNGLLKGVS